MKIGKISSNEKGVAHLGLMLVIIVVMAGVGYLVYMRFDSQQSDSGNSSASETVEVQEELGQEIEAGSSAVDEASNDVPEESGEEEL